MAKAKRDPYLVALGDRVAALRRAKRLTQEQLAERASLGTQYVSSIERALVNPSLRVLRDVAKSLGTTVKQILPEPDETGTDAEIAALLHGRSSAERRRALVMLRSLFIEV